MNTRLSALALVLTALATLATACDTETAATSPASVTFRDDETVDPPTRPVGTVLIVKGGHDDPTADFSLSFRDLSLDQQLVFFKDMHKQAIDAAVDEFFADESNFAECPKLCGDLDMTWNEGASVRFVHVQHGEVVVAEDELGLHWETEAEAIAEVSCGCVGR